MPSAATYYPNFSVTYIHALRDVEYHMVASLAFLVWDFLLSFNDEVEYIWSMRNCMFKLFYFYLRYIPLLEQVFHYSISSIISSGDLPDHLCTSWYRYMLATVQIASFMLELTLATRVFALFNRSRKVDIFLGALILSDLVVASIRIARFPSATYFEACMLPLPAGKSTTIHAAIFLIVQSVMVGMTVYKVVIGVKLGLGRTPIVSFLMRDATSIYVAMFLLGGTSLAICGLDDRRTVAAFFFTSVIFWKPSYPKHGNVCKTEFFRPGQGYASHDSNHPVTEAFAS